MLQHPQEFIHFIKEKTLLPDENKIFIEFQEDPLIGIRHSAIDHFDGVAIPSDKVKRRPYFITSFRSSINSEGVMPAIFLNVRLKVVLLVNPHSRPMARML